MSEPVAHLAGADIEYGTEAGTVLRQRCSWCGTVLVDENLSRISVPVGQQGRYPTWPIGAFVETYAPDQQGGMWTLVEWEQGQPVPANACMRMPPELTA